MIKKSILSNALSLNTYKKNSGSVSISVAIKAGSFLEGLTEPHFPIGTAHFLEHMIFKGTPNKSQQEISNAIFEVGGDLNAFTDFEETRYIANTPKDEWKLGLDLLLEMLTNASISADDVDNERSIIAQEIKMYADDPSSILLDAVQASLFPLDKNRHSISGTEETIADITAEKLQSFFDSFYVFENMIVTVVGNIDHEEVAEFIESINLKVNPTILPAEKMTPPPFKEIDTSFATFVPDDKEQSYYTFGMVGPSVLKGNKMAAFEILSLILGGSDTSRLFMKVREENGLCYDISTGTEYFKDYTLLSGFVGTSEEHLAKVEDLIISTLEDLSDNNVTQEELDRAKKHLKGRTLMNMDSNSQLNSYITESIQFGLEPNIEKYIEDIMSVELDDIKELTDELFNENNYFTGSLVSLEFDVSKLVEQV